MNHSLGNLSLIILIKLGGYISNLFERSKTWMLPILVAVLMFINVVVLTKFSDTSQRLVEQQSMTMEIKTKKSQEIKSLSTEKLNTESSLKEERLKTEKLEGENQSLKVSLQAKKDALAAQKANTTLTNVVKTASNPLGNPQCVAWLAQVGISDMASAVELQQRENGSCDPQKYNMGGSDACGLAQELPCGKSGCGLPPNADGFCQIQWMHRYVIGRYGSWAAALNHHDRMNWY